MRRPSLLALVAAVAVLTGADAPPALPSVDAPLVSGATATKDFAVVVGIEAYGFLPKVDYAERDATAVADALTKTRGIPDARVIRLIGRPSRAQIVAALTEAGRSTAAGGTVWVYFAGHGAADPRTTERMILPVETTQDEPGFASAGIPLGEVQRLASAGGGQALVVTDACYAGTSRAGAALLPGTRLAVPPSLRPPTSGAVWVATGPSELAAALPAARHGAFTYALLGALRGWADGADDGMRDGVVTSAEASLYVRTALRQLGVEGQSPSWSGTGMELVGKAANLEATPRLEAPRATGASAPGTPAEPTVLFQETFQRVDLGLVPAGWAVDTGLGVKSDGRAKCLGELNHVDHKITTPPVSLTGDFAIDVDAVIGSIGNSMFVRVGGATAGVSAPLYHGTVGFSLTNASTVYQRTGDFDTRLRRTYTLQKKGPVLSLLVDGSSFVMSRIESPVGGTLPLVIEFREGAADLCIYGIAARQLR